MFPFPIEQTLLIGATGTFLPFLGAVGLYCLARRGTARVIPVITRGQTPDKREAGARVETLTTELRLIYSLLGPHRMEDRLRRLLDEVRGRQETEMAAVFRFDGRGFQLCDAQGLSPQARQRIVLDAAVQSELSVVGALRRGSTGHGTQSSVRGLKVEERAQWPELSILRIGSPQRPWGALVTSQTLPTSIGAVSNGTAPVDSGAADDSGAMWQRVLALLGEELARSEQVVSRESELDLTREMLELRKIADLQFPSPARMLQEFLSRTAALADFERISLYLALPAGGAAPPMIRAGIALTRDLAQEWAEAEDNLFPWLTGHRGVLALSAAEFPRTAAVAPFGMAAAVPLLRDADDVGLLVLTRRGGGPVSAADRRLIAWAGEFLLDLLARTVDRITIEEQARIDGLTLLANRRTFDQEFERLLDRAAQSEQPCSLLLLDLDRFKQVNDTRGHQAGDTALRTVAHVVQRVLARTREGDQPLAARYGGEELAVLLPGTDGEGARRIAEAIREAVERTPVRHGESEFFMTLSGGVATSPQDGRTTRSLLTAADVALYVAKNEGRNRIQGSALDPARRGATGCAKEAATAMGGVRERTC